MNIETQIVSIVVLGIIILINVLIHEKKETKIKQLQKLIDSCPGCQLKTTEKEKLLEQIQTLETENKQLRKNNILMEQELNIARKNLNIMILNKQRRQEERKNKFK